MNIVKATKKYESWLALHTPIVAPDLAMKHREMAKSLFSFLRATFYRWAQVWPEVCPEAHKAPSVLGVGDLHVENFGTWRDSDGRLVWGINDFDEAEHYPHTLDLVRLATSALVAAREDRLVMRPKDAVGAILDGYQDSLQEGGLPFVLAEGHAWLRQIAESRLRDPVQFWRKMDELPTEKGTVPKSARQALEQLLPESGLKYRLTRRRAGLGSLGRIRFVAIADWRGGKLAREAKALTPPATCWLDPGTRDRYLVPGRAQPGRTLSGSLYEAIRQLDCPAFVSPLFAHRAGCFRPRSRRIAALKGDGMGNRQHSPGQRTPAGKNSPRSRAQERKLANSSRRNYGPRRRKKLAHVEGKLVARRPPQVLFDPLSPTCL